MFNSTSCLYIRSCIIIDVLSLIKNTFVLSILNIITLFSSIFKLDFKMERGKASQFSDVRCSNSSDSFLSTDFINFIPSSSGLFARGTLGVCNGIVFKMLFGKLP